MTQRVQEKFTEFSKNSENSFKSFLAAIKEHPEQHTPGIFTS